VGNGGWRTSLGVNLVKFAGGILLGILPLPEPLPIPPNGQKILPYEDPGLPRRMMVTRSVWVVSQGLVNGTPLIYLPGRISPNFRCWRRRFRNGAWLSPIQRRLPWIEMGRCFLEEVSKKERPKPVPPKEERFCAREIENFIRRPNPEKIPAR